MAPEISRSPYAVRQMAFPGYVLYQYQLAPRTEAISTFNDPNAQLCCWTYFYWKFGISTLLVSGSEFLSEDQVVGVAFYPRPKGNLCSHDIESRNPTLPHNLPLLPIIGDISSALSPGWLIGINHFLAWESYVSIYNIQLDLPYPEEAVIIVDPKPWWFILTLCRVLTF